MKDVINIEADKVFVGPGSYRKVSVEIKAHPRDILDNFTLEEIFEIKDPDVEDVLDRWTMEKVLEQYDVDDVLQWCRERRLDGLV
jgi:hypothetical protein